MNKLPKLLLMVFLILVLTGSANIGMAQETDFGAWVLTGQGDVDLVPPGTGALPDIPSQVFSEIDSFRDLQPTADINFNINGYYLLDYNGHVYPHGGAIDYDSVTSVNFGWDIARRIAIAPDYLVATGGQAGLYLLDGFGGVHLIGGPESESSYFKAYRDDTGVFPYFGFDISRDIESSVIWVDVNGEDKARTNGYYLLDGFGAVHWCIEDANFQTTDAPWSGSHTGIPKISQPFFGWDIARNIELLPNGLGYILLDGYGNMHPVGNPSFAFPTDGGELSLNIGGGNNDVAVDLQLVTDDATGAVDGIYVLDKFGIIYNVGNVPAIAGPNYTAPKAKALAVSDFFRFVTGSGVITDGSTVTGG